jgi:excisionase family DNA binding protein
MKTSISQDHSITPTKMRQFSKAKVIAERLGVCRRTIFRWANEGKITRYKVNERVVLFDEAEVLAFIESARVGHAQT